MAVIKIWCLFIDHEKKAAYGNVFGVTVPADADIDDLTKKVKEERSVDLEHVDAARLTVWRCTDSGIDFGDMDSDDFNNRLKEVFSPDEQKVKKLKPKQELRQLTEKTLLIEVPDSLPCPPLRPSSSVHVSYFSKAPLASKDLRTGTPENRIFTIDEHTPRKPVKATEDLVQKTYSGVATIPAKRPRLSDGIQSYDVYQSSGVVPLDENETNSEHRLSFLLYSNFWRKGNLEQMIRKEPHLVPDVDLSSFPDSYGMSFESDDLDHPTTVEAKFLDLAELPGWSSELAEVFVTKILIRKEYGELDEFPLLLPC